MVGVLASAYGIAAQDAPALPIRTEALAHPLAECPAWDPSDLEEPSDAELAEARSLSTAATEAALLGDQEGVRDLLRRATELNPRSEELAYRRARAHDELGETEEAIRWYCRALALRGEGQDAGEIRRRLARLQEPLGPPIDPEARERFQDGVELLQADSLNAAAERFSSALAVDSAMADAYYNRGLAYGALQRRAAAVRDLRAYLERRPEAQDRARVQAAVQFLEEPPVSYGTGTAFALSLLVPGGGQFYTDRNLSGSLYLAGAAGAVAAGFLYEEVEVLCLSIPRGGNCPEEDVVSRTTSRPLLAPAVAVWGAGALISAITAWRGASARNQASGRLRIGGSSEGVALEGGVRLAPRSVAASPQSVAVELLRLSF